MLTETKQKTVNERKYKFVCQNSYTKHHFKPNLFVEQISLKFPENKKLIYIQLVSNAVNTNIINKYNAHL